MHVDNFEPVSHDLLFSKTLLGKECGACHSALPYNRFNRDSSVRDGYALICNRCASAPRESTAEAVARVRESNENSYAISQQKRLDEDLYQNRDCRGRSLYHTDFVHKLKRILGTKLVVAPAHFLNEVCLYISDPKCEDTNGYRYIGFLETDGKMNEFSEYEYNEYGVPIGETRRGYRGILKNLIMQGYITEQQCSKEFGPCDEKIWNRDLYLWRNQN